MSPGQIVRDGLARADRRRRTRETSRRLWRAAPAVALTCVGLAAASRWAGWPAWIPLATIAAAGLLIAAVFYVAGRDRPISDAAAAAIDAQAGFKGELRSASWFAKRDAADPWVDFHLQRAAQRLQSIDWSALYPSVRAAGAKAATSAMAIAAVALAITIPGRAGVHASATTREASSRPGGIAVAAPLPPALQKQLEDVLATAENTKPGGRALTAADVRDLLAKLDERRNEQRRQDAEKGADQGDRTEQAAADIQTFAERAKRASNDRALKPDVRDALSQVANTLAESVQTQAGAPKDPRDAIAAKDAQQGDAAHSTAGADKDEASVRSIRDASAGGGAGVIMMAGEQESSGGEPGLGLGGASSKNTGGGRMPDLGAALRRETIEASADNPGENVVTGVRRKTEHADATVGYTHAAPGAFERGRSAAAPAVPEGRRTAVRTYFTRKQ